MLLSPLQIVSSSSTLLSYPSIAKMPSTIPPSSLTIESKAKISSITSMPHNHNRPHLLLPIFLLLSIISLTTSSFPNKIAYHQHCDSIVPESTSKGPALDPYGFLQLQSSYFTGGETFFSSETPQSQSFSYPKSIYFRTSKIHHTETPGVLEIESTLIFRGGNIYSVRNSTAVSVGLRHYRSVRPHSARVFHQRGKVTFELRGFWSESSGKLCMVGTGFGYPKEGNLLDLSAVFKLNYPKTSNITTSLVTGTVESLDAVGDLNYFDKISVLAFAQKTYEHTLIQQGRSACNGSEGGDVSLELESSICGMLGSMGSKGFQLEYEGNCSKKNCSIFDGRDGSLPSFMTIGGLQCSDNVTLQMSLQFSNSSPFSYYAALAPETLLVGEGVWDREKNRVCLMACRVLNSMGSLENTTVGDCSIGLTFRFPKTLSVRVRSFALGRIWSTKKVNESGYFDSIGLRSLENRMTGASGQRYEYSELGHRSESCRKKEVKKLGKRYPDGYSFEDMRFDISVKKSQGRITWGYLYPLTVGDMFYYNPDAESLTQMAAGEVQALNRSLLNVSYMVSFTVSNHEWGGLSLNQTFSDLNMPIDISAEGVYDAETGILCMVGCRYLGSGVAKKNETVDCEILINVELAPFDPEAGKSLKGTIKSTREKSDPIYFEPLQLFSNVMYASEAIGTIRRMDLELIMVLISLMLACVFIGLQLLHVKKHPDLLPSISLMMLVILTLGYMIPLVLNFEAFFFSNRNRQNVLLWSGGWLEVNEVVVRVVTMIAFLLQFRLLQLTWSARLAEEGKKCLWIAEMKALCLCLPLYIVGGLVALFTHWKMYEDTQLKAHFGGFIADSQHSIWEDLRSYAGLILDGFLLPQVLLNLFLDSKEKALAPFFYIGTTTVRSLPHAYDAYRAHEYAPRFNSSYFYANPNADLYSPAWDIIIPCGGLLFAILVYLQQRFGGAFILPLRFRRSAEYEKVPVVSDQAL